MKRLLQRFFSLCLLTAIACVDVYEIGTLKSEEALVVDGVFSDIFKRHQIFISRTTSFNQKYFKAEEGAEVTITDQDENVTTLSETKPGIYETPETAAVNGATYTLKIKTAAGKRYTSTEVLFKSGPDIDAVNSRYVETSNGKGVEISVNTEDPTGQTRFYRWNFIETYEVRTPFPSVWRWLGGNEVIFREDSIDICYVTDTLRNILTHTTKNLEQDKVVDKALKFIPEDSYSLTHKYSMLVQQFALSEEAFLYWENLRQTSEQQGTLSDRQPGTLPGNIISIDDPSETVIGFFEACKVSEKRIFVSYVDFYKEGFVRPPRMRSYCLEILPILAPELELGAYMEQYQETMYIWEVYGFSPDAVFQLMPKRCCDCRDLGPITKPSFF
jgi:hypothetical protein